MPELNPTFASRIPARNRRQAMDWSLVLASQAIEHVIEHSEETGWALAVAEPDYKNALHQIRQYRLENRHWRWRRPVFQPGLIFDWRCIGWVFLNLTFYWWSEQRADLRSLGMTDGAALEHGEWWRLFTAIWLHADLTHLAMNTVFGFILLGLAMGRYGAGVGLLAAYLAGAVGNVASFLSYGEPLHGLGASGMVMGALGLLTVQSFVRLKQNNSSSFRRLGAAIMGGLLLFVFLGMNPEADVVAHLGGFVAGMILGALLSPVPRLANRRWLNLAAAILFAALVVLPWLRALA